MKVSGTESGDPPTSMKIASCWTNEDGDQGSATITTSDGVVVLLAGDGCGE